MRAVPEFLPVPALAGSSGHPSALALAVWPEGGDVIAVTHSIPILASPARTGFLSPQGGREVFDSPAVRCLCDKPGLNSSRSKVAFKCIIN